MSKAENKLAEELAPELWAAAQLLPNEGIENGISRIKSILEPHLVGEWQPIESAPKTGERILVGHGNAVWEDEWFSPTQQWREAFETCSDEVPTHWQPLPAPPKGEQSA